MLQFCYVFKKVLAAQMVKAWFGLILMIKILTAPEQPKPAISGLGRFQMAFVVFAQTCFILFGQMYFMILNRLFVLQLVCSAQTVIMWFGHIYFEILPKLVIPGLGKYI